LPDHHLHPPQDGDRDQPAYDRWSRPPALSRRGYVLAVVVPLVVAACAFGLVSVFASDESDLHGTSVRLPVAAYGPGAGTPANALIAGTLRIDDDDCAYLEPDPGTTGGSGPLYVVWPAGFEATLDGGRLSLFDADEHEIGQDGDHVQAQGELVPASTYATEQCVPADGQVAVVESQVVVTH
jgi:hypothetical protein